MAYLTASELKATLELTGTTYADADITAAIAAAEKAIDDVCHRTFEQDAAPVARYYTAVTPTLCSIGDVAPAADDLTTEDPLAVVAIDRAADKTFSESWTEDTDYQLEPLNARADGKPYEWLRALRSTFPAQSGGVRVTARFGWTAVPAQVTEACSLLAAKLIVRRRQAPLGIVIASIDAGVAMRVAQSDPDVRMLLSELTRDSLW